MFSDSLIFSLKITAVGPFDTEIRNVLMRNVFTFFFSKALRLDCCLNMTQFTSTF